MLRIGIDVGGTHTDAALLDGQDVIATVKVLTTSDVSSGVIAALDAVLADHSDAEDRISAVMLGTTQFTNAVVERRQLCEVSAIRIGLPSGDGLPPKIGWPEELTSCVGRKDYMLRGGYLYDGWPLADLDLREVDRIIEDLQAKAVPAVAISSAFSPMKAQPELQVAQRISNALPECRI